jgi:N-acetylglucosamine-6-phosphate deacetylase
VVFQAKGPGGITLVTDAMEAMGMPPGTYKLSDREVFVDEHSARLADGTLAGSVLKMDQAVRNAIRFTGCSLEEALRMASTTPARVLGLENKGNIFVGADADLVVLDEACQVTHTFVKGKWIYAGGRKSE